MRTELPWLYKLIVSIIKWIIDIFWIKFSRSDLNELSRQWWDNLPIMYKHFLENGIYSSPKFLWVSFLLPIISIVIFLYIRQTPYRKSWVIFLSVFNCFYNLALFCRVLLLYNHHYITNSSHTLFPYFFPIPTISICEILPGITWTLSFDIIAFLFVLLSDFIILLCFIFMLNTDKENQSDTFIILLFVLQFLLLNFFLSSDLFFFYIFFESVLIPLFLIVGLFGSRIRRIHAAYQLFFFTLIGSFTMLVGIIYIYLNSGTTAFSILLYNRPPNNSFLWLAFFLPLAIKIPLVPFHIWLPEAHVEAPTVGSVILAAIILKMGGFGIIRILLFLTPFSTFQFRPLVFLICSFGMIFTGFTALRQIDIKKIIAYSSVVHMSYATLGLFTHSSYGIFSAILAMISHGIISAGLFFAVGSLYNRFSHRDLHFFSALYFLFPELSFVFFIYLLANIAFPGTASFPLELGILFALFDSNFLMSLFVLLPIMLNGSYNIWLATRLCFGPIRDSIIIKEPGKLNHAEYIIHSSCIFLIFFLGLKANLFFKLVSTGFLVYLSRNKGFLEFLI